MIRIKNQKQESLMKNPSASKFSRLIFFMSALGHPKAICAKCGVWSVGEGEILSVNSLGYSELDRCGLGLRRFEHLEHKSTDD